MSESRYRMNLETPIGVLVLEGTHTALTNVWLPGRTAPGERMSAPGAIQRAAAQLEEYFAGERTSFDVALAPRGTAFQLDVWRELEAIAYGEVITYAQLARRVGRPKGFRAVGQANGRNPLPIIVPCHRVVASNGLGGYAGGVDVKRALLELEESTLVSTLRS